MKTKKKSAASRENSVTVSEQKELLPIKELQNINYNQLVQKAVEVFGELGMLNKNVSEIKVKDLEINKLKSNNFMKALGGMIEVSRHVDLISSQAESFKRADELKVLNSLRRSSEKLALGLEATLEMAQARLAVLMEKDVADIDPAEIALLHDVLGACVDTNIKLVSGFSRLLQVHNLSGRQGWGTSKDPSTPGLKVIENFDSNRPTANGGTGKKSVQAISEEEMLSMRANTKENYEDDDTDESIMLDLDDLVDELEDEEEESIEV